MAEPPQLITRTRTKSVAIHVRKFLCVDSQLLFDEHTGVAERLRAAVRGAGSVRPGRDLAVLVATQYERVSTATNVFMAFT